MRLYTATALAAVLTIALAGCTAGADAAGSATDKADTAVQQSAEEAPVDASEPLVAEAPSLDGDDQRFLDYVRSELLPETQIGDASDTSLVEAGHKACEQVLSGVAPEDVRVVEGETPAISGYYMDSLTIRNGAQVIYCPETL